MSFVAPQLLWGLAALPVLVVLYHWARRRRSPYPVIFTNLPLLATIVPARRWLRVIPPTLFLLAMASLVVGLARPQATVALPREEATVVLALDGSSSMSANDVKPNRLAAAKRAARDFVATVPPRFQIGIVSFDSIAEVLAQPTVDRVAVRRAIASIEAAGSTAIGEAIVQSVRLDPERRWRLRNLPQSDADPGPSLAAVILLSDGVQTAGNVTPLAAAARAKQLGLPVYTVALAPGEAATEQLGSSVDTKTLRAIAARTGARYFIAPTTEDLRSIYRTIGSRLGFVKGHQELTFAFAGAGLLLALIAAVLGAVRWWGFP